MPEELFTIGYAEDGVMRVVGPDDPAEAEDVLAEWDGEWRVIDRVYVGPDGMYDRRAGVFRPFGGGDEYWEECYLDDPMAQAAWRLVDTAREEVNFGCGTWQSNPYFRGGQLHLPGVHGLGPGGLS